MTRMVHKSERKNKGSRIPLETQVAIRTALMHGESVGSVAKRLGVSDRSVQVGCPEAIPPEFCPGCRSMVIMPCLLCFIRNGGESKSA